MMMYLFLRPNRSVLDLVFLRRVKWCPPSFCVCVKTQAGGSNCFLVAKISRRWTFEWKQTGSARLSLYLLQLVGGSRNNSHPEVNVDALIVVIQNKRKLRRSTDYFSMSTLNIFPFQLLSFSAFTLRFQISVWQRMSLMSPLAGVSEGQELITPNMQPNHCNTTKIKASATMLSVQLWHCVKCKWKWCNDLKSCAYLNCWQKYQMLKLQNVVVLWKLCCFPLCVIASSSDKWLL